MRMLARLLVVSLLAVQVSVEAEELARESFQYSTGVQNASGGYGFSAPFSTPINILDGNLNYVDPLATAYPSDANRMLANGNNIGHFRTFDTSIAPNGWVGSDGGYGENNTTVYVSILVNLSIAANGFSKPRYQLTDRLH